MLAGCAEGLPRRRHPQQRRAGWNQDGGPRFALCPPPFALQCIAGDAGSCRPKSDAIQTWLHRQVHCSCRRGRQTGTRTARSKQHPLIAMHVRMLLREQALPTLLTSSSTWGRKSHSKYVELTAAASFILVCLYCQVHIDMPKKLPDLCLDGLPLQCLPDGQPALASGLASHVIVSCIR